VPATGSGAASSDPLISIALCTYNGAECLSQQLESLRSQSWRNIEIVAVDDASSDQTWQLLAKAASQDARFRLWRNETNLGFSANFERALSLCAGDFIAPCDQDDVWLPNKLELMMAAMGPHVMAYCDSVLTDAQGNSLGMRISDRLRMAQGSDPLAFAFWNCISGHAMLFRRELLQSALPIQARFHDWWLTANTRIHRLIFRVEAADTRTRCSKSRSVCSGCAPWRAFPAPTRHSSRRCMRSRAPGRASGSARNGWSS
jgi:glycosyltransferase involved in cell wall biosynthesis